MYCSQCGTENQDTSKFCSSCGRPIIQASTMQVSPPTVEQTPPPFTSQSNSGEKLPFWRKIPGYRSKTKGKMIVASFVYGLIILALIMPNSKSSSPAKPTTAQSTVTAVSMYQEADGLFQGKNYTKAQQVLNDLLKKYPDSAEAAQAKSMLTQIDIAVKQQEEAKAQAAAAKKAEQNAALSSMRTKYDEVKSITWFYDKSTSQYFNENDFYVYFGKEKEGKPWLRFRIQFGNSDWIFIKKYTIKVDDQTFTITPSYNEVKQEVVYGNGIGEWIDVPMDAAKYKIVKAVATSSKTILRVEGDKFYKDRTITQEEKSALQNVLLAYEASGGTLNY